jgi:hypothetical protein
MDRTTTGMITTIGGLAVAVALGLVWLFHAPSNNGFADASAALAFVGAAAIGIERTIEGFWTIVGATGGTFWPLSAVNKQVGTLVDDLNVAMKSFHDTATNRLQDTADAVAGAQKTFKRISDEKESLDKSLEGVTQRLTALAAGPRDNQRLQLLAATASQNVSYVSALYGETIPDLQRAGRAANAAINGLQDFIATFKDNPGRRLVSLFLGVLAGLVIAGCLGLDLVTASLESNAPTGSRAAFNIVVTGILIGLGSNPTHEVIRAIQEYKKGRKGENALTPDQPTSPETAAAPTRPAAPDSSTLATSQRIARMLRRLPDQPAMITSPNP